MKLRDHPLMKYMGVRSWPPAWLWRDGGDTTYPQGEVGILKDVMLSKYLLVNLEHCGAQYIGALLVSEPAFQREICKILFQNRGQTIQDIGEIDISYTF